MTLDENDRHMAGSLPADPAAGTRPANAAARRIDAERLNVLSVRELLRNAAEEARTPRPKGFACTTGHFQLNDITNGFEPGFVWVLGAQTSWGKSSWAIQVADENIRNGKRVLIVSAEDPATLYARRLLARRARVSADRLRKRSLHRDELARVAEVEAKAEDVPVYVEAVGRSMETLQKHLRPIIRGEGIDMLVFDYIQEFYSDRRHQDQRLMMKETSRMMRELIRENGKTGIILSQLTITTETKIPNKHNIRESRDISNAAEVIGIGFTPAQDVLGDDPGRDVGGAQLAPEVQFHKGRRYLLIDKNKEGPAGEAVELDWDPHTASFRNVEDPELAELDARTGVCDSMFDSL